MRGGGTVMSHPFQGGVGDRDESTFPRRGGGTVMSHPLQRGVGDRDESFKEGGTREGAPPITAKGGGGAPSKHSIPAGGF